MYTRLYRKGLFQPLDSYIFGNDGQGKNGPISKGTTPSKAANKPKKPKRKPPKKAMKYGPKRTTETSWARDLRLMVSVINAMKDAAKDADKEMEKEEEKGM